MLLLEEKKRSKQLQICIAPCNKGGKPGPEGSQGPAGTSIAGGLVNTRTRNITLRPTPERITFSDIIPTHGLDVTMHDRMKVEEGGAYLVQYRLSCRTLGISKMTLSVNHNDHPIEAAMTVRRAGLNDYIDMFGSTMVILEKGAVVDMTISANILMAISLAEGANASLMLMKLG